MTGLEVNSVPHSPRRPYIGMDLRGCVTHNGKRARVVMKRGLISVGCSDAEPAVLEFLLAEYKRRFTGLDVQVIQEEEIP